MRDGASSSSSCWLNFQANAAFTDSSWGLLLTWPAGSSCPFISSSESLIPLPYRPFERSFSSRIVCGLSCFPSRVFYWSVCMRLADWRQHLRKNTHWWLSLQHGNAPWVWRVWRSIYLWCNGCRRWTSRPPNLDRCRPSAWRRSFNWWASF